MKIKELIKQSKLSSRKLESLTDINHTRIWRISKGAEPLLSEAKKIYGALGYVINIVSKEVNN